MTGKYDDIINLPHHVSPTRAHMSNIERAAQFSPFAALVGYDETISETARLTDEEMELSLDQIEELDARIQAISGALDTHPLITVTYFIPDDLKSGGAYVDHTGNIKNIDAYSKTMLFTDGTKVPVARVISIEGELFGGV
ncbi:MAG: YolD-like family protein [Clostridia bacterium]|nr:YolD-like family protein [Clostridia bacterium]